MGPRVGPGVRDGEQIIGSAGRGRCWGPCMAQVNVSLDAKPRDVEG
ncbi:hypothetical protein I2W78_05230 [Streptomyces spinoverrucosus]|nr:hypothetical protein [Streptomyces spinoverrucosus]MBG0851272.1 hypothetical protein [Streptomyces spinoverrucosus]